MKKTLDGEVYTCMIFLAENHPRVYTSALRFVDSVES